MARRIEILPVCIPVMLVNNFYRNSNITIDVTGRKIYGIRTGFYDQKAGDQDGENRKIL